MSVTVGSCPCGTVHEMASDIWARFERTTAGLPPEVTVETPDGKFLVPRIYIACHGLKAAAARRRARPGLRDS